MENWYQVFYWLTVADGVKSFFDVASDITTFFWVVSLIFYVFMIGFSLANESKDEDGKIEKDVLRFRKMSGWIFWGFSILSLVTWFGYVAVPTKKDAVMILVGGSVVEFMTTDSVARQIPSELLVLARNYVQAAAAEQKVELVIQNQKEKILQEIKNMTPEQISERMKVDTTFAKYFVDQYVHNR